MWLVTGVVCVGRAVAWWCVVAVVLDVVVDVEVAVGRNEVVVVVVGVVEVVAVVVAVDDLVGGGEDVGVVVAVVVMLVVGTVWRQTIRRHGRKFDHAAIEMTIDVCYSSG